MATSKRQGKATKPVRKKRVAKKKVAKKKASKKKVAKKVSAKGPVKDHMKLLESWAEFVKVPITQLNTTQLKEMLEHEKVSGRRWSFINRLHGAFNAKRVKAERDELRRKYQ